MSEVQSTSVYPLILFYLSVDCLPLVALLSPLQLNNNIRNSDTLSKFKSELKKIDETENHSVPKHFFCDPRTLNIILSQLRSSGSFLNFDLFRVGIVSDPSC
jgi:hypothetical protein